MKNNIIEFWSPGRNKNPVQSFFIKMFHSHDYVFSHYPTKNSRAFICKDCGRMRVFEYEYPVKSLYRFFWKHSDRTGQPLRFGYYRSGDPNNDFEKDWIIELVR